MKKRLLIPLIVLAAMTVFISGAVYGATAWSGTVTATTTETVIVMDNVGNPLATSGWTYALGNMPIGTSRTVSFLVKNVGVAPVIVDAYANITGMTGLTGSWNQASATVPVYTGSNAVSFVLTLNAVGVGGPYSIPITFSRP
jgi:hypothetical protein